MFRSICATGSRTLRNRTSSLGIHSSTIERSDDKDRQRKIATLKLEMELERNSGNALIPNQINERSWDTLLGLSSVKQRMRFYERLKMTELKIEQNPLRAEKQRERKRRAKERIARERYEEGLDAMFLRLTKPTIDRLYLPNLLHAVFFGQNVVFDLGYEVFMERTEMTIAAYHIEQSFLAVREDREAFHLHFCNANLDGDMVKPLKARINELAKPEPLMTLTRNSYLDLFPKERIVYLVPDCGVELEYDFHDVYVIGGFLTQRVQNPISLIKAKSEGVRMAEFPLDKYLGLKYAKKDLSLHVVMKVLITLKETGDWQEALKHVPLKKSTADARNSKMIAGMQQFQLLQSGS